MNGKMSKGTIVRWVFAALFLVTGFGYFTDGVRGIIGGMVMICAAFLMSPLSTQIGAFGKKSAIAVCASVVSVFIAAAILPSDEKPEQSAEQPTRTVIAENSEEDTTAPETSTTTVETTVETETTVFADITAAIEATTNFEIDLRAVDITTVGGAWDRGVPTESSFSFSSTTKTIDSTATTTSSTGITNTAQTTASTQAVYTWILNTSTKKFHYKSCRDVSRIDPENYLEFTGTYSQVIAMGYSECGHCNPHG